MIYNSCILKGQEHHIFFFLTLPRFTNNVVLVYTTQM